MFQPWLKTQAGQQVTRAILCGGPGGAGDQLRHHHIFKRGEFRQQMMELIDKANLQTAQSRAGLIIHMRGWILAHIDFAGIWPFGRGAITHPENPRVLFLPQKPYLTIGTLREQLCYPSAPDAFDNQALIAALHDCRLPAFTARLDETQHWAQLLSGGEQQRVAIARAVANAPRVLLADEPTGNLDPRTAQHVFGVLTQLVRATGLATLVATHNMELAHRMDRRVTLRDGLIVELD